MERHKINFCSKNMILLLLVSGILL